MEGRNPDFAGIQSYLKFNYNIEKFVCDFTALAPGGRLHCTNCFGFLKCAHVFYVFLPQHVRFSWRR